jgi:hypothetical protein
MDTGKIIKFVVLVVVVLAAIPFIPKLLPKPASFERAVAAFQAANLEVTDYAEPQPPGLESIAQASMVVNGARVDIYLYDDEGRIVRNVEFRKKDAGSAIVETWNLAQSLGAAPSKNRPEASGRNGMFMIVATGDDQALLNEIVRIFKSL